MPRSLARASAITAAGALGVSGVGLLATAFAAPAVAAETCTPISGAPTATLVATGVCQVVITDSGAYTIPTSIAKVSAVVIGAGGGGGAAVSNSSTYAAGGGGGQLVYVDSVGTGSAITATIGAGGTASPAIGAAGPGGSTVFGGTTALGGGGGTTSNGAANVANGGTSGSGNAAVTGATISGTGTSLSGGGGAQTAPPDNSGTAGTGWSLSAFVAAQSGDATLFPAAADGSVSYGDGGAASATGGLTQGTAFGDGGVAQTAAPSTGVAGAVILRYAATEPAPPSSTTAPVATSTTTTAVTLPAAAQPELADTGSDVPFAAVGGGIALTVAGAMIAAFARLRRRSANGTR